MISNSYIISPNSQYRQHISIVLTESEISDLYQVLTQFEEMHLPLPKVAKDLKLELWYMMLEVHEENAYLEQGGEP